MCIRDRYYVETENVGSREGVEKALKSRLAGQENPTVSLHCDKSVAFDEVVAMMRMAKANNFTLKMCIRDSYSTEHEMIRF